MTTAISTRGVSQSSLIPNIKENMRYEKSHDALVSACQDTSNGLEAGDHALHLMRDGASVFGTSQSNQCSNALINAPQNTTNKILKYLKAEPYYPSGERVIYHALEWALHFSVIQIIIAYDQFSGLNQIERLMYGRARDIGTIELDDETSVAAQVAKNGDIENFNAFLDLGFNWKTPMYGLMWKHTSYSYKIAYEILPMSFSCNWVYYTTPISISFHDYIYEKESLKTSLTTWKDTINFAEIPDSIILRIQEVFASKNKKKRKLEG